MWNETSDVCNGKWDVGNEKRHVQKVRMTCGKWGIPCAKSKVGRGKWETRCAKLKMRCAKWKIRLDKQKMRKMWEEWNEKLDVRNED